MSNSSGGQRLGVHERLHHNIPRSGYPNENRSSDTYTRKSSKLDQPRPRSVARFDGHASPIRNGDQARRARSSAPGDRSTGNNPESLLKSALSPLKAYMPPFSAIPGSTPANRETFGSESPQQEAPKGSVNLNLYGGDTLINSGEFKFPRSSEPERGQGSFAFPEKYEPERGQGWKTEFESISAERKTGKHLEEAEKVCIKYDYALLEEATDNFNEKKRLGKGGEGTVYRGKNKDNMYVAVKVIDNLGSAKFFEDEIGTLSKIRHPNIVMLMGWATHLDQGFLVYEFLDGGDVDQKLRKAKATQSAQDIFPLTERIRVAEQAACGLSYMINVSEQCFHRDIKPANLLLDKRGTAKMADFGMARRITRDSGALEDEKFVGTPGYACPVYMKTGKVTEQSEVYSFGILLLQLVVNLQASTRGPDGNIIYPLETTLRLGGDEVRALERVMRNVDCQIKDSTTARWDDQEVKARTVAKLALACVANNQACRPPFRDIVKRLQDLDESVGVITVLAEQEQEQEENMTVENFAPKQPHLSWQSSSDELWLVCISASGRDLSTVPREQRKILLPERGKYVIGQQYQREFFEEFVSPEHLLKISRNHFELRREGNGYELTLLCSNPLLISERGSAQKVQVSKNSPKMLEINTRIDFKTEPIGNAKCLTMRLERSNQVDEAEPIKLVASGSLLGAHVSKENCQIDFFPEDGTLKIGRDHHEKLGVPKDVLPRISGEHFSVHYTGNSQRKLYELEVLGRNKVWFARPGYQRIEAMKGQKWAIEVGTKIFLETGSGDGQGSQGTIIWSIEPYLEAVQQKAEAESPLPQADRTPRYGIKKAAAEDKQKAEREATPRETSGKASEPQKAADTDLAVLKSEFLWTEAGKAWIQKEKGDPGFRAVMLGVRAGDLVTEHQLLQIGTKLDVFLLHDLIRPSTQENERKIREEAEKKIREEEVALERERHHQEFMRKHEENQKRVQETLELENKRQEYMRKELDDQKRVEEEKKRQEYIRKHKEDQKRLDETKYQQDPLDEVMASKKDVIDLEIEYDTSLREGVTLSAAIALKEKVSRTKDNLSKIDPRKGPNTNSKHRADLMKEATKYRIDLLLGKTDKLVAQVREVMQRRQQQEENPATWLATIGDWELTLDAEGAFFWHKSTGAWQVDPPPQVLRYFDPTNIDRIPDHMFNMILENYAVMPQALANAALHKMARMKAMRKQEEERRKREDYARSKAAQLQIGTVPLMQQWGNHDIFQQGNIFFQDLCSQYLTQALPSQPSYVPPERSIVDIYFPPQDQSRVPRVCRGELQIVQPQHFLTTSPAIYMTRTGL